MCFTQNAIFLRSDLAERLRELQGRQYEIGVNRLYFEALLVNWNDMIRCKSYPSLQPRAMWSTVLQPLQRLFLLFSAVTASSDCSRYSGFIL